MLDLPGSTPVQDLSYLEMIFKGNQYQSDYCKLYFCLNLPYTQIRKWYNNDKHLISNPNNNWDMIHEMMTNPKYSYEDLMVLCNRNIDSLVWRPYSETDFNGFHEVSEKAIMMIPPWTRCVRVQRDFCQDRVSKPGSLLMETTQDDETLGYVSSIIRTNENQMILRDLKAKEMKPLEIRGREINNNLITDIMDGNLNLVHNVYRNADGTEHYISIEYNKSTNNPTSMEEIYNSYTLGHVRLRIPDRKLGSMLPDIRGKKVHVIAIIRELHVYGRLKGVSDVKAQQYSGGQGQGIGKLLMYMAEKITLDNNCNYISVISGVGVRMYYSKLGYSLSPINNYMIKDFMTIYPICLPKQFMLSNIININKNINYHVITRVSTNRYKCIVFALFMFILSFSIASYHMT